MILQALNSLYGRLIADPSYELPARGYRSQLVSFRIVLQQDGSLYDIHDARSGSTKPRAVRLVVPDETKSRTSGIDAYFLCDTAQYCLGYASPDESAPEHFAAFKKFALDAEPSINDSAFSSVCRFLESWSPDRAKEYAAKLEEYGTDAGVFQIQGTPGDVHERPAVKAWVTQQQAKAIDGEKAQCLVTGEIASLARTHPAIKKVEKAQSSGAPLVSFNCDAFSSYGKEQSFNAPVSDTAAFQYANALNAMLAGPMATRHRVVIGNATCVFWTERQTVAESLFSALLGYTAPDELVETSQDEGLRSRLKILLEVLRQGGGRSIDRLGDDAQTRFFFLGLSPNAARLSVRFWHVDSLGSLVDNLKAHYDALRVDRPPGHAPEFPTARQLLGATAIVRHKGDQDDTDFNTIPPLLSGPLLRAILTGGEYPRGLYQAVLQRIRADRTISYFRAAVLKAFLNRNHNHALPMSLDPNRPDPAYRLGRLFSVLEFAQEDAGNSGLKDRFYSAASATPATVFSRIIRTSQHHLSKLGREKPGLKVVHEKAIQEILAPLADFPAHLTLQEQGLFAIGYYHQRQARYTKKDPAESTAS